ncbi:hypothetical protein LIER_13138 [Lithospermum erythrorhizon]|uniref:DUF220 domain-containing protein n=1 Tax=Lithospermum erythrorhizon TaxID=34254 RepID=A0AAV3PUK2_LITER
MLEPSTGRPKDSKNGLLSGSNDVMNNLIHFPRKVQEFVGSHFRISKDQKATSAALDDKIKRSSGFVNLNLQQQLHNWKENPAWVDQPSNIKVTVPKGSLCNLNVEVNVGLPPDTVFDIVTDPDNKRVFKNIKEVISRKVLVNEGLRQVVEVEQAAIWKFLWWSGTFNVRVIVDQNRENYSMKFKQVNKGFMERFEGSWKVEPIFLDEKLCDAYKPKDLEDYISCSRGKGRVASKVTLQQYIQPSIVPPPPISWYVRGITTRTSEMIINDLQAEAARIRGESSNSEEAKGSPELSENKADEYPEADTCNIKQRWAMQRREGRGHNRRFFGTKSP